MNPTDRSIVLLREATDPERGLVRDLLHKNDLALVHVDRLPDPASLVAGVRCNVCGANLDLRGSADELGRVVPDWIERHEHPTTTVEPPAPASTDDEEPF